MKHFQQTEDVQLELQESIEMGKQITILLLLYQEMLQWNQLKVRKIA